MKVKELIEELQKHDQELKVLVEVNDKNYGRFTTDLNLLLTNPTLLILTYKEDYS